MQTRHLPLWPFKGALEQRVLRVRCTAKAVQCPSQLHRENFISAVSYEICCHSTLRTSSAKLVLLAPLRNRCQSDACTLNSPEISSLQATHSLLQITISLGSAPTKRRWQDSKQKQIQGHVTLSRRVNPPFRLPRPLLLFHLLRLLVLPLGCSGRLFSSFRYDACLTGHRSCTKHVFRQCNSMPVCIYKLPYTSHQHKIVWQWPACL